MLALQTQRWVVHTPCTLIRDLDVRYSEYSVLVTGRSHGGGLTSRQTARNMQRALHINDGTKHGIGRRIMQRSPCVVSRPSVCPSAHSCIHLVLSSIFVVSPRIHPFIHPSIDPSIHPSIHASINPSIHSSSLCSPQYFAGFKVCRVFTWVRLWVSGEYAATGAAWLLVYCSQTT